MTVLKFYLKRPNRKFGNFRITVQKSSETKFDPFSARCLVQWLWEETHVPKAMGSNPSGVYWMDIFHINLL